MYHIPAVLVLLNVSVFLKYGNHVATNYITIYWHIRPLYSFNSLNTI